MQNIIGVVQDGSKRAGVLGYPTINIPFSDAWVSGVYAASVDATGKKYNAAVFADPSRGVLEAHLLDYAGNLYGQTVTMELHQKIRESAIFDTDDTLKAAIAQDVRDVRQYFAHHESL